MGSWAVMEVDWSFKYMPKFGGGSAGTVRSTSRVGKMIGEHVN